MILKIALVEDEENSSRELLSYLKRFQQESGIKIEVHGFQNGLDFIEGYQGDYDVVLMDINMPHLNGLNAAKRLRIMDENVCLIFVTNMAKYAIKGYEVNAMDFMVKPVSYLKLAYKLKKIVALIQAREKSICVKTDNGIKVLKASDIYYIEVNHNVLTYHVVNGQDLVEKNSLKNVENFLQECNFARCNNCYLINLRYVDGIEEGNVLVHGQHLSISRNRKKNFLNTLTQYLGRDK